MQKIIQIDASPFNQAIDEFKRDPQINEEISEIFLLTGPVNIQEIINDSEIEIDFSDKTHYFGEIEIYYQEKKHPWDKYINGKYQYIGMLCKESNQPSGLGRLINITSKEDKNIQEGLFKEGKRIGIFRILQENGNYSKVIFEDNSIKKRQVYDQEGNIQSEEEFLNEKWHGKCIYYFQNGKIQTNEDFKNGQKHGKCISYYQNGQIYSEEEYENAKLNGQSFWYFKNGKIQSEGKYENGNGVHVFYDINGNKLAECEMKDGRCFLGERVFFNQDGSISYRWKYQNGRRV